MVIVTFSNILNKRSEFLTSQNVHPRFLKTNDGFKFDCSIEIKLFLKNHILKSMKIYLMLSNFQIQPVVNSWKRIPDEI